MVEGKDYIQLKFNEDFTKIVSSRMVTKSNGTIFHQVEEWDVQDNGEEDNE